MKSSTLVDWYMHNLKFILYLDSRVLILKCFHCLSAVPRATNVGMATVWFTTGGATLISNIDTVLYSLRKSVYELCTLLRVFQYAIQTSRTYEVLRINESTRSVSRWNEKTRFRAGYILLPQYVTCIEDTCSSIIFILYSSKQTAW